MRYITLRSSGLLFLMNKCSKQCWDILQYLLNTIKLILKKGTGKHFQVAIRKKMRTACS